MAAGQMTARTTTPTVTSAAAIARVAWKTVVWTHRTTATVGWAAVVEVPMTEPTTTPMAMSVVAIARVAWKTAAWTHQTTAMAAWGAAGEAQMTRTMHQTTATVGSAAADAGTQGKRVARDAARASA